MGLNFCAGAGIALSLAAAILLIFGEISQLNSSTIPRHLRIVSISTVGLSDGLRAATGGSVDFTPIYGTPSNAEVAYSAGSGLRYTYEWGFYSHCASYATEVGATRSYCSPRKLGSNFAPDAALYEDIPQQYKSFYNQTIGENSFSNNPYLVQYTTAGGWMVFVGAIVAGLAFLTGFLAHRFAFLVAALFSLLGALMLAVGLAIYTILISRAMSAINGLTVGSAGTALGITLAYGSGLWIMWAGTAALFLSIVPYMIACCTGRRDKEYY